MTSRNITTDIYSTHRVYYCNYESLICIQGIQMCNRFWKERTFVVSLLGQATDCIARARKCSHNARTSGENDPGDIEEKNISSFNI